MWPRFRGRGTRLLEWVEKGGLLLRFAGPRLAASDVSRNEEDPLMPVRLRAGGRTVGGAMSWGEPKALAPFPEDSPFFGLPVPDDVTVTAQVMAQPDPTLAERVIAQLEDGTPLVTRKRIGRRAGGAVPRHRQCRMVEPAAVGAFRADAGTAGRLVRRGPAGAAEMEGTTWQPVQVLDASASCRMPARCPAWRASG